MKGASLSATAFATAAIVSAMRDVGETYAAGVYTWAMPAAMAALVLMSMWLGYMVRKEGEK